jgi:hypothetical protein
MSDDEILSHAFKSRLLIVNLPNRKYAVVELGSFIVDEGYAIATSVTVKSNLTLLQAKQFVKNHSEPMRGESEDS